LQGRLIGDEYVAEARRGNNKSSIGIEIDLCQIRATDHVNRSDEAPAKGDLVEQPLTAPIASEHPQQQERPSRFRWLDPPEQFSAKP
jgi:hypothetical protein